MIRPLTRFLDWLYPNPGRHVRDPLYDEPAVPLDEFGLPLWMSTNPDWTGPLILDRPYMHKPGDHRAPDTKGRTWDH